MNHRAFERSFMPPMFLAALGAAVGLGGCSSSNRSHAATGGTGGMQSGGTGGNTGGTGGNTGGTTTGGTGQGGNAGTAGNTGAGGAAQTTMKVTETDLVSDQAGQGAHMDANLVNAWGLSINPAATNGPLFWVSATDTGTAEVYDATGQRALVVNIPSPDATMPGAPTGQVYNASSNFMGDKFVFATEDGTIVGWQSGDTAMIRADQSASQASYKGLAIVNDSGSAMLWAANFHGGTIDVFDSSYHAVDTTTGYTDPNLPAGYAPFDIAAFGSKVYVTYAKQDDQKADDVKGAGFGQIDVYNPDGTFAKRLVTGGALNAPWGLAMAPTGFGPFEGALLVGNFGDGAIIAYDPDTGAMLGQLADSAGKPLAIDGLWAIAFGPHAATQDLSQTLFFTAGPNEETHGLFGTFRAAQ